MKTIILFASVAVAGGLVLTNIYTSMVDVKSWGSNIPTSVQTAREYFKVSNPGDFFRIFSPLGQVLAILALIVFWKAAPHARLWLATAAGFYILGDVITFAWFYPKNDIIFKTASLGDTETLSTVISKWSSMNWVRTLVVVAGLVCSCISLHRVYNAKQSTQVAQHSVRTAAPSYR